MAADRLSPQVFRLVSGAGGEQLSWKAAECPRPQCDHSVTGRDGLRKPAAMVAASVEAEPPSALSSKLCRGTNFPRSSLLLPRKWLEISRRPPRKTRQALSSSPRTQNASPASGSGRLARRQHPLRSRARAPARSRHPDCGSATSSSESRSPTPNCPVRPTHRLHRRPGSTARPAMTFVISSPVSVSYSRRP